MTVLSSTKGVESAPFFLIVSSLIMIFTISVFFPSLINWTTKMNDAAAMRETEKLRDAINEISSMGDLGSVEKLTINLPPGYLIKVEENQLITKRMANQDTGAIREDLLTLQLDAKATAHINSGSDEANEVFGDMSIELTYGKPDSDPGKFQIYVG